MARKGFAAVVESGSCSRDYELWEERINCGHLHKTVEAAEACGKKNYGAHYENGTWRASAAWHGYTVHDQDSRRACFVGTLTRHRAGRIPASHP